MVIIYTIGMSYLSILRHNAFASSYDLANADQTVWNSLRGNFFSLSGVSGSVSRFSLHADLILAVISPIFLVWDNVRMLLITQSFLIGLTAIPTWLIGKLMLKNKLLALGIAGAFLLNPAVIWANMYDFHGVTIAMAMVLFCVYFGLKKEWRKMYLFALLSALTKEEIPLILSVFGLILIVFQREKRAGVSLLIGGFLWFSVMTFLVIPHFSESGTHWAWGWFGSNGGDTTNGGVLQKINNIFLMIVQAKSYCAMLLSQWAFLPLIGLPWTVMAGPDLLINTLSTHGEMRSTIMHYESGIMPGMILGTIFAVKYIGRLVLKINQELVIPTQLTVVALLLMFVAKLNYFYSPLPTTPAHWKLMYLLGKDEIEFEKVLQSLPKNASVTASSEVRNHLTHRLNVYNLPNMIGKTDYIAMVDQNRIVGDYEPKEFETELINELKNDHKYQLVFNQGHFFLFKLLRG